MPPSFEFLDHPSDIGILGRGASREEALIAVSNGLTSIMADPAAFRPDVEREFHLSGSDPAAQVINWLNEILFFFDTEGLVFVNFAVDSWTNDRLAGRAQGEHLDLSRHELRTSVKAATYHQFEMTEADGGWELRVFIDV
jgi:SHS2 domain-containing protein